MAMFRIWFIDDNLAEPLRQAARREIGPENGAFADWRVIASAEDAMKQFRIASEKDALPDVALIDMHFGNEDPGLLDPVNPHSIGFHLESALRHYAERIGKDPIITLYTADPVAASIGDLFKSPLGHKPLVALYKNDLGDEGVMSWAREAVNELARRRIRNGMADLPVSACDWLDAFLREFETTIGKPWKKCWQSLETQITSLSRALLLSWEGIPTERRFGYLRTQEIENARSKEEILSALDHSTSPLAQEWRAHICEALEGSEQAYARLLAEIQNSFQSTKTALLVHPAFLQLASLFPFEAQRIAVQSSGDTFFEDAILSLRQILAVLGAELDYHYSLARALKYWLVGTAPDPYGPTTALAHACHKWRPRNGLSAFQSLPRKKKERHCCRRSLAGRRRKVLPDAYP
jgi:hypothetical protein